MVSMCFYQTCSKNCEISNFRFLPLFSLLTWDYTGVKVSNDISPECIQQICPSKCMYTHGDGLKSIAIFQILKFLAICITL